MFAPVYSCSAMLMLCCTQLYIVRFFEPSPFLFSLTIPTTIQYHALISCSIFAHNFITQCNDCTARFSCHIKFHLHARFLMLFCSWIHLGSFITIVCHFILNFNSFHHNGKTFSMPALLYSSFFHLPGSSMTIIVHDAHALAQSKIKIVHYNSNSISFNWNFHSVFPISMSLISR